MTTQPVLLAENLHKTYTLSKASLHILRGASLAIQPGETVAITGRSGSGKSTLLHILGGLDKPDNPKQSPITIHGTLLSRLSERGCARLRARDIGFVFQSYHLMREMNVVENVILPSMALGHPDRAKRERAIRLLRDAGLGDRLHHRPMELSGGEQQRVAIARAMMNAPAIILADEPTGNLDPSTGRQILDMLLGMAQTCADDTVSKTALIIVTHSQEIASRCDRTLHLESGLLSPSPTAPTPNE